MAFFGKKFDGKCDNCGKDLDDVEEPIKQKKHEFCSEDCEKDYKNGHEHDKKEEEPEICEFC